MHHGTIIYYIHYTLLTCGLCATSVLLAVYLRTYSQASEGEIGVLLMTFPFASLITKPLFCSIADRKQAYKKVLIISLLVMLIGFSPFLVVPFFEEFYSKHRRLAWYIFALFSHIGLGGLSVAWTMGDTLAINMSQRTSTPYSRMRLVGTLSWGVFGYAIGQANETPTLPRYVPAFMMLFGSVFLEIVIVAFWNDDDFRMVDANNDPNYKIDGSVNPDENSLYDVGSAPSSAYGTIHVNSKVGPALRDIFAGEELAKKLENVQANETIRSRHGLPRSLARSFSIVSECTKHVVGVVANSNDYEAAETIKGQSVETKPMKNPQIIIFKMMLSLDGRLAKSLALFTVAGVLLAPMNFFFLSLEEVCRVRGYNFSALAGTVLISQSTSEILCFFVLPWFQKFISPTVALSFGLISIGCRYLFYASILYTTDISPYWAAIGEWGHGICYGMFCTIMAESALKFAKQSKFFIPELRKRGYLSAIEPGTKPDKTKIQMEENSIRMALRATMQAVFGGCMDGLGSGGGNLFCGVISQSFSYVTLWWVFTSLAFGSCLVYLMIELTKCRWSDSYQPLEGTKAYQIRNEC